MCVVWMYVDVCRADAYMVYTYVDMNVCMWCDMEAYGVGVSVRGGGMRLCVSELCLCVTQLCLCVT